MRFEQQTIWFEIENKDGYPKNMFISSKYTLSDRLQAGVKLDAYYWCLFRCYIHFG